jgi:hypothetical protein
MKKRTRFPRAINPSRVGKYPAVCKSGGGFVWDAVLEYRVWCHPERGAPDRNDGSDYYYAFASYPAALRFSTKFPGAEEPLALILQKQYIVEPSPGQYVQHEKATHNRMAGGISFPLEAHEKHHSGFTVAQCA